MVVEAVDDILAVGLVVASAVSVAALDGVPVCVEDVVRVADDEGDGVLAADSVGDEV